MIWSEIITEASIDHLIAFPRFLELDISGCSLEHDNLFFDIMEIAPKIINCKEQDKHKPNHEDTEFYAHI